MITDRELAKRIADACLHSESQAKQTIHINVQSGVVYLTGTVQSYRRKLAAQEIAEIFDGCREVINKLTIEPPGTVSDEEIAESVRAALAAHADITKEAITVTVNRGTVVLKGEVTNNWERLIAEDVTLSARGVRKVENGLLVDPAGVVGDQVRSQEIQKALRSARELRAADITVAVSGDHVVLSGTVSSIWQKEMAARVARRLAVHTIQNDIAVADA